MASLPLPFSFTMRWQADGAAGAVEVEHLDAAGDLVVLHHLGGRAGGGVVAAAGGVGDHEPQAR